MKMMSLMIRMRWINAAARFFPFLGLALMLAVSGCGQNSTSGPEAEKLRKDLDRTLGGLGQKAEPLLARDDVAGLDHLILEKYDAAVKGGKPLTYGMAVLSKDGKVVSGRYPALEGKSHRKARKGINFGRYDSFKKVLGGKSASCLLYTPEGTMYAVCVPLREKRKVIGMVCVGYPEVEFKRKYEMDQDKFLAMSFD